MRWPNVGVGRRPGADERTTPLLEFVAELMADIVVGFFVVIDQGSDTIKKF